MPQERNTHHKERKLREAAKPGPRANLFISRHRVNWGCLKALRKGDIRRDAGYYYATGCLIGWTLVSRNWMSPLSQGFRRMLLSQFISSHSSLLFSCHMTENSRTAFLDGQVPLSRRRSPALEFPAIQPLASLKAVRILYRLFSFTSSSLSSSQTSLQGKQDG